MAQHVMDMPLFDISLSFLSIDWPKRKARSFLIGIAGCKTKPRNKDQFTLFQRSLVSQRKQINLYLPQIQAWCRTRCKPNRAQASTIWARQTSRKEPTVSNNNPFNSKFHSQLTIDILYRCISLQIVFKLISTCYCANWITLIIHSMQHLQWKI